MKVKELINQLLEEMNSDEEVKFKVYLEEEEIPLIVDVIECRGNHIYVDLIEE